MWATVTWQFLDRHSNPNPDPDPDPNPIPNPVQELTWYRGQQPHGSIVTSFCMSGLVGDIISPGLTVHSPLWLPRPTEPLIACHTWAPKMCFTTRHYTNARLPYLTLCEHNILYCDVCCRIFCRWYGNYRCTQISPEQTWTAGRLFGVDVGRCEDEPHIPHGFAVAHYLESSSSGPCERLRRTRSKCHCWCCFSWC